MQTLILIAAGGAVGTLARYATQLAMLPLSTRFPWGTLAINLIGCFLIGWLQGLFAGRWALAPEYRLALLVGVLGGYTTFSTLGWETASLLQHQHYVRAMMNVAVSNILGVALVFAGYALGARSIGT